MGKIHNNRTRTPMCCCIKSRALPQWTIFILSIATCITSGLMIAYAVVFIYSDLVENLLNEEFLQRQYSDIYDKYGESAQEYAVAAFACFAGLAMLMAVCGCCCKCLKGGASRTCACLYGFRSKSNLRLHLRFLLTASHDNFLVRWCITGLP